MSTGTIVMTTHHNDVRKITWNFLQRPRLSRFYFSLPVTNSMQAQTSECMRGSSRYLCCIDIYGIYIRTYTAYMQHAHDTYIYTNMPYVQHMLMLCIWQGESEGAVGIY